MPSQAYLNSNINRLARQVKNIESDILARIERCKDERGDPNSETFRNQNPEIQKTMGEWLVERKEEWVQAQRELDDYKMSDDALNSIEGLMAYGSEKAGRRANYPVDSINDSLGDLVLKHDSFNAFVNKDLKVFNEEFDGKGLKTLFETTSQNVADNVSVESVRTGEYVMAPRTRVTLLDMIPQAMTSFPVVKYDEEVKNLSGVAPIAQGAAYTESEFTIREQTVDVEKAGAYIQVSEELLQDRPEMRARLDGSLMSQLMRRIQADIIGGTLQNATEFVAGAATSTGITGFLDLTNDTQINHIDGSGKNQIEAIEEGAEEVYRNGIAEADGILMNSQDWVSIKTLQSTTGAFVLRGANAPLWMPAERMIDEWPVVLCNALPQGTVLIGAFRDFSQIRDRQSAQVRIQEAQGVPSVAVTGGNTAVTQTQPTGRYNIYVDVRYTFYVRRGLAFTKITAFGA